MWGQAARRRGHCLDRDGGARAESQAALGILRMASSLREVPRQSGFWPSVPELSRVGPGVAPKTPSNHPAYTEGIGSAWKSRSCLGQRKGWAQSPCLAILSGSLAAHCAHHEGLFAAPLWVARASHCPSTIAVALLALRNQDRKPRSRPALPASCCPQRGWASAALSPSSPRRLEAGLPSSTAPAEASFRSAVPGPCDPLKEKG